jgi:ubiquinone/menaquinone biosynthesis C-methylase UbiE
MLESLKAEMFNRAASDPRNKPNEVLNVLKLQQGQVVADIGAGGGYSSLRFAEIVGKNGRVFAVDTNQKFLEYINNDAREKGLENVKTILVPGEKLDLPEKSLDLIFMRNVCHHLRNRVEYFRKLGHFLKPNGKVAIIERSKPLTLHGIFGHYVPRETIIKEMEKAGFIVKQEFEFLPNQSFIIFVQNELNRKIEN